MPPRFYPGQANQTPRPLQNELVALQKLLNDDILEQAAHILDHYTATTRKDSRLDTESVQPPAALVESLTESCNQFETVCDQIYYVLEQSKRVLQLDWQQRSMELRAAEKTEQQQQQQQQGGLQQQQQQQGFDDMGTDLSVIPTDFSMDLDNPAQKTSATETVVDQQEEEDMEELLQLQTERMDRLRSVLLHGVDAQSLMKLNQSNKEDILF